MHTFVRLFPRLVLFAAGAFFLHAQEGMPSAPPLHGDGPGSRIRGPAPSGRTNDPLAQSFPPGKWWDDPAVTQAISLTPEQRLKIDAVFQQSRLHLIDLKASLEKEDALLDPLVESEHPVESQVLQQIDRIAQARAELEKANARFILRIRAILTADQWRSLQRQRPQGPPQHQP